MPIPARDLKPGSKEAIESGCKCPILDNGYGRGSGRVAEDGTPLFWYSDSCPIHGEQSIKNLESINETI